MTQVNLDPPLRPIGADRDADMARQSLRHGPVEAEHLLGNLEVDHRAIGQ